MTMTSSLILQVTADYSKVAGLATSRSPLSKIYQSILDNGTGVGKADLVYHGQRTLAPSATEDLDLIGTMLQDPLGANLSMLKVKGLIIAALGVTDPVTGAVTTPNTNNVVVGAAAANAWTALLNSTGTLTLPPGGVVLAFAGQGHAGYTVTAGTNDLLKVANSAGVSSVTYDIILIGATA